jgi:hypothetical protein
VPNLARRGQSGGGRLRTSFERVTSSQKNGERPGGWTPSNSTMRRYTPLPGPPRPAPHLTHELDVRLG